MKLATLVLVVAFTEHLHAHASTAGVEQADAWAASTDSALRCRTVVAPPLPPSTVCKIDALPDGHATVDSGMLSLAGDQVRVFHAPQQAQHQGRNIAVGELDARAATLHMHVHASGVESLAMDLPVGRAPRGPRGDGWEGYPPTSPLQSDPGRRRMPELFMQNFPLSVQREHRPLDVRVDCDERVTDAALYVHVPDLYNLYHSFFDVLVPIVHTMATHGLSRDDTQLIVGHNPVLTHSMPWLDEDVAADFACTRPPFDLRGWQFLPYLQALVRKPIRWMMAPDYEAGTAATQLVDESFHLDCLRKLVIQADPPPETLGDGWTLPNPFGNGSSHRLCFANTTVLGVDASPRIWALTDDFPGTPAHVPRDYAYTRVFRSMFDSIRAHGPGSRSRVVVAQRPDSVTFIVRGNQTSRPTAGASDTALFLQSAIARLCDDTMKLRVIDLAELSLEEQVGAFA